MFYRILLCLYLQNAIDMVRTRRMELIHIDFVVKSLCANIKTKSYMKQRILWMIAGIRRYDDYADIVHPFNSNHGAKLKTM